MFLASHEIPAMLGEAYSGHQNSWVRNSHHTTWVSSQLHEVHALLLFPWSWAKLRLKGFAGYLRMALGLLQHTTAAASCRPSKGNGWALCAVTRMKAGTGARQQPGAPLRGESSTALKGHSFGCFLLPQQRKNTLHKTRILPGPKLLAHKSQGFGGFFCYFFFFFFFTFTDVNIFQAVIGYLGEVQRKYKSRMKFMKDKVEQHILV